MQGRLVRNLADLPTLENSSLCRRGNCNFSSALRKIRLLRISPAWGVAMSPEDHVEGLGAELCYLPRSAACARGAAVPGAECFSETLSALTADSRGKQVKGYIYLQHLTGVHRDFYALACYCSVNISFKTCNAGLSALVCVSLC